jgi:hypothetical protein
MTQLRFQGPTVINDCRTSLQLLKDLRHHMSRHRETRRSRYPMSGGITVYPFPWRDLGHRSHHMSSGRIGLLLYVAPFSVSVVRMSVTPQCVVATAMAAKIGQLTTYVVLLYYMTSYLLCPVTVVRAKKTNPGRPRSISLYPRWTARSWIRIFVYRDVLPTMPSYRCTSKKNQSRET